MRAAYGGEEYVPQVFHPEHIPERYGLFTLIVLGESVLVAGTGWDPSAVLGGGAALYLAAISFIHWVNRRSLDDRVVLARLGTAAFLICLVALGTSVEPTIFTGLLALAMLSLTAFEVLYAGRLTPG